MVKLSKYGAHLNIIPLINALKIYIAKLNNVNGLMTTIMKKN